MVTNLSVQKQVESLPKLRWNAAAESWQVNYHQLRLNVSHRIGLSPHRIPSCIAIAQLDGGSTRRIVFAKMAMGVLTHSFCWHTSSTHGHLGQLIITPCSRNTIPMQLSIRLFNRNWIVSISNIKLKTSIGHLWSIDLTGVLRSFIQKNPWILLYGVCLSSRIWWEAVAYAENFHWGVSFSGLWWSFVFDVRSLWHHNLTSY